MTTRSERIEEAAKVVVGRLGSQRPVHRGRGEEWICEVSREQLLALAAALSSAPSEPAEGEREAEEILRLLETYCASHCREMLDHAKTREDGTFTRALFSGRASVYSIIASLLRQSDRLRILRIETGASPRPPSSPDPQDKP